MIRFLLRLSLCTAALAAVTTTVAHAADFEPPLPEMRGSWTGDYDLDVGTVDLRLRRSI
jgi:hypothetical protein